MMRKRKIFQPIFTALRRTIILVMAASLLPAGRGAAGAIPAADSSTLFPEAETLFMAKTWQMQPFEPEDAKREIKDVAIDDLDSGDIMDLGLDDDTAARPVRSGAQSAPAPSDQPELRWPTEGAAYWGWFRFQSGAWWATTMLMHEANTLQFELPRAGVEHDQYGYNNIWLRDSIKIDDSLRNKSVTFSMDGLAGCDANLYINHKKAGTIYRPGGELDVSDFLEYEGQNEFLILVSANGYQIPPVPRDTYMGRAKGGSYTGIGQHNFNITGARPRLSIRPATAIFDVFANTSWREKKLSAEVSLDSGETCQDAKIEIEVYDPSGTLVKSSTKAFAAKKGKNCIVCEIPWEDPVTWEFGRGYLYTMRTTAILGGKRIGYPDFPFGFREIWRDGRKIFMNGHEQKFRMCYNFGAGLMGAEFLSRIGYNVIQYAHNNRDIDPAYDEKLLYGLAEKGIGCAIAAPQIFWAKRNALADNPDIRADYNALLAKNLRRYRNIPSVIMAYVGVNINIQNWTQDALHLGSYADGKFDKLINSVVASAHETNPNILFYSHGDGINGDIATANLYFNWIPLQERVEWPSRWAVCGHFPFQAAEFGHPYEHTWGRDGHHDVVSELLAIYYGDKAYRQEPQSIRIRHGDAGLLYIRRMQHPLYWQFLRDFVWGINRSWRTFGINGGVAWFNLDQGFGMPGWELDKIWNEYGVNYSDATFKKIGGVPKGRPDWAFPSWDIYQLGNKDFLGYIGGWPRHTDKRHAYRESELVEKQIVMLDDSFAPGAYSAKWRAYCWDDGENTAGAKARDDQPIATGIIERRQLESNVPRLEKICFIAPQIQGGSVLPEKPRRACLEVEFFDSHDQPMGKDSFFFEICPYLPKPQRSAGAKVALFDPRGNTEVWLKEHGISECRKIGSPDDIGDATHLVIGSYSLKDGKFQIPSTAVEAGLKILIMEQTAEAWEKMGFKVYDVAPRRMWLRDTANDAFAGITDDHLHDWAGQPQLPPGAKTYEGQIIGHLAKGSGPRWTRNMAVASLVLRTPDVIGFIPQIEGEFDMNMSALLRLCKGKGSIQFCTLSLEGRTISFPPATKDAPDDVRPVRDPVCEAVSRAVLRDFLSAPESANVRHVEALGTAAKRLASECGLEAEALPLGNDANAQSSVILAGPDANASWEAIAGKAKDGAHILVFANEKIAMAAGFTFAEPTTNYCASFDASGKALRGIGQNLLRWRSMMLVRPYDKLPTGFTKNADGLFAVSDDGRIVFTAINPFQIENRLDPDGEVSKAPVASADAEKNAPDAHRSEKAAKEIVSLDDIQTAENVSLEEAEKEEEADRKTISDAKSRITRLRAASMTIEHGYQLFSRLLTNLGAAPSQDVAPAIFGGDGGKSLYNLPYTFYDPYFFKYW